ncbi:inverse autotransporter beta domain-containing protein, partial [Campylobacter sp. IFREMER_LSEM_CL2090]|uniref:inverse autotransporter beta domain-containing protein n=4 Tax=unclassified Campylobacter TaxID=2593542 RepID=UPI0021E7D1A0
MKKTLLFVLLIHTFLFSQIMILKNQDKIIIDNNQTLALNHVNHDQKQILKEHNNIDSRVKKLLEEKPKKDSNLSKEDEELSNKVVNVIQTIGNVYNAKDSKERDELIRDLASNYLSLQANTLIQEYLHALNHSINSEFNLNYNDRGGLSGNAKVLLPIMSEDNPKISYFLQSGIGGYDNNRIIGHFGGGIRYYPNALALDNSGNIMLGLNLVYDHDFSREHKRISLGFESMLDTLAFHANIYQRLSDWVSSYDFKNANNDLTFLERPANGWDMGIKYAFPSMSNVAVFANMSKWYGEKVAPFGNVNCYEDLEKNPLVYEGGITYSPCPALTFSLSHKRSNESDKQGTNIAMNFNIPLDKDAFKHAFDTKLAGINNTIEGSRTHFIDRDYSMVLEYKAINNTYHISYCGNLGGNTHCIMLKDGFNQAVKNVAMSVTPEQKSVILKDGNHYITDSNGKVFVKIIHSYGVHQTNLIAKAGNAQESFPIAIIAPKEDFRIFAKPSNIQRYEKSLITFTGNDLAGDLAIHWKLNGKGSLEKTPNSDKTDKDGNSNIIYKPDVNMKDKEKAEIIVNVLGVTLKTFVQIAIYGDNDIILDKAIIGNKEKTHASYKNLKANSTKVKWSIQGDNALFVDKDKTTKELNLIADDKGESNVEIIGLSGNEKVKIIAKNMSDELVKERSKDLEIKNYTATMELPAGKDPVTYQDFEKGMIDYKSDFEVKLKGLMPKTKVLWKAKDIQSNKTLRISNDKESTADDKGESKVVFEGVKDFNIKRLQIIATYNQSAASTQEVSGEIKLHQYTPSISFSKDKIHAYESDNNKALKDPKLDHVEVTLKGGKPNEKIEWSLSGDATLSNQEATFNASGEAKAVITSKAPFKVNPNLEVKTMTKDLKKELPYEIKEYTPKVEGFSPKFEKEDTLDYKTDFSVQVSNLLPNSKISITKTQIIKPKKEEVEVNNKGEATLEFEGINDFSQKEITITFNYIKKGDEKAEQTYAIKLHQYTPSISFSKDKIHAYESDNNKALKDPKLDHVEVTLKGGKPNEKIEWSLSGDATLSNQEATFNASGEAKAVITSKAPFKVNPNLEVKTMTKDLKKELPYEIKEYTPKVEGFSPKFEKEDTLDYKTDFSVQVSNLLPNSKISITKTQIIKPKKEEVEVNNKGEATLEFEGINDFSQKEITITFNYIKKGDEKAEQTYAIKLHQYTPSISFSKDKIHAYESDNNKALKDPKLDHVEVTLKGGKPNEKIEWSLSGDATLSNQEATFNASGEAKAVITSKAPFKVNPNLEVKTMTKDLKKELPYEIKEYTPKVEGFSPKFEKEDTLDYKTDFSVQVSNLLPNSKISITKTQIIKPKKEEVEVNNKGEATLEFEGINDFSQKEITITFNYIKKGDEKAEQTYAIKLHQYTPSISFSKDKIHAYESDNNKALKDPKLDHVEVTLKGGKPNEKIEWSLSGDATLSNQEATFNASGEAKAVITSKAPFKVNPNLEVKTMTKDLKKELPYEIKEYTPKVEYPSFKTQEKTIDYIDDFNIKISGLLPNSTIDKISGSKGVKAKKESFNVSDKGEATLEFSGISDYSVKDIAIKFNYIKQGSIKKELNLDKIKLYQYAISFNADPSTIIAEPNKNAEVTLKGGKPNEKIEWSLSGDATLTKTDKVFNVSGEAKAVITSKAPFKTNPIINVNTLGQNLTKTLTYIDGTIYTPKIEYPSYKVSFWKTLDKTIDYDSDYVLKISGLLPNSTIDKISGSKGVKAKKESFNVNDKGEATLEFSGISDPSVKDIAIKFSYMKSAIAKTEITADKINLYQRELNLELDKETLYTQEGEVVHAVLKGGKTGSKVEWSLSGDATLNDHDTTFNASGEAKAVITSKAPFENDILLKVNALGGSFVKSIKYKTKIYTPEVEYPSYKDPSWWFHVEKKTIDYDSDYVLKISGLLPNSTIDKISGSKGVKAKKESFNVSDKGEATLEFSGISDYNVKDIAIKFNYMKTRTSKIEFAADKIKLYQRELKFEGDKTIYTEEKAQANITLKDGKKGAKVEWNISGDATLNDHDITFNSSGEAKATITSKTPFKNNPVISVNTIGQSVSTTIAYVDKEYIPSIIYPSYKGYKQTIELNQDFHLEVSNLIPNTEIEIYHDFLSAAKPKQDHVRVNSSGKATLEFYGVSNPLCSNFNIQFKYMKTKNKSADFFTDEIYIYKQLTLI